MKEAKILAVADLVEAMASHRPYRPAKGIDQALEENLEEDDGQAWILHDLFKPTVSRHLPAPVQGKGPHKLSLVKALMPVQMISGV